MIKENYLQNLLSDRVEWKIIPLRQNTKIPFHKNWQQAAFSKKDLEYYVNEMDCNIGLVLGKTSGNVIDVDVDDPIATKIVELDFKEKSHLKILPFTYYTFGRDSKPLSHILYKCEDTTPKQFKDVDGNLIVEIRGDNQQTRIPFSRHLENGELEQVEWFNKKLNTKFDLLKVNRKNLEERLELLVILTYIAKKWSNANGSRHNLAMDISGIFLKKYTPEQVKYFIKLICLAVGDEELKDRLLTTDYTKIRIEKNLPYTKYKTIKTLFGDKFLESIKNFLYINTQPNRSNKDIGKKYKQNNNQIGNYTSNQTIYQTNAQKNIRRENQNTETTTFENIDNDVDNSVDDTQQKNINKKRKNGFDMQIYADAIAERFHLFYDIANKKLYYWNKETGIWQDAENMIDVFVVDYAKKVLKIEATQSLFPNSINKIEAVIRYIKSKLANGGYKNFNIDEIDNSHLIPFNNVVFDLKEKRTKKYTPEMGFKFKLQWNYVDEIVDDSLIQLIKTFNENSSDLLYEILAAPMYRHKESSRIFILYGKTRNGKSTFCDIMNTLYKKHFVAVSIEDMQKDPFAVDDLYRKGLPPLVSATSENKSIVIDDIPLLKAIITKDSVRVRRKFKDANFEKIYTKFVFSYNNLPYIPQDNEAIFGRIIVADFPHTFKEDYDFNERFRQMLRNENKEVESLLHYLVQVLIRLVDNKFTFSYNYNDVASNRGQYLKRTDSVGMFLEERCEITQNKDDKIRKLDFYKEFKKFCEDKRIKILPEKLVGKILKTKKGIYPARIQINKSRQYYWTGIKFKENANININDNAQIEIAKANNTSDNYIQEIDSYDKSFQGATSIMDTFVSIQENAEVSGDYIKIKRDQFEKLIKDINAILKIISNGIDVNTAVKTNQNNKEHNDMKQNDKNKNTTNNNSDFDKTNSTKEEKIETNKIESNSSKDILYEDFVGKFVETFKGTIVEQKNNIEQKNILERKKRNEKVENMKNSIRQKPRTAITPIIVNANKSILNIDRIETSIQEFDKIKSKISENTKFVLLDDNDNRLDNRNWKSIMEDIKVYKYQDDEDSNVIFVKIRQHQNRKNPILTRVRIEKDEISLIISECELFFQGKERLINIVEKDVELDNIDKIDYIHLFYRDFIESLRYVLRAI